MWLWAQILRRMGVAHQRLLAPETRVPGLSRGVVCVILRLAVLLLLHSCSWHRITGTSTVGTSSATHSTAASAGQLRPQRRTENFRNSITYSCVLFFFMVQFKLVMCVSVCQWDVVLNIWLAGWQRRATGVLERQRLAAGRRVQFSDDGMQCTNDAVGLHQCPAASWLDY